LSDFAFLSFAQILVKLSIMDINKWVDKFTIATNMGSSGSKLKKKLVKGDETAALSLFDTNKDLHKKFDPNVSYGDRYNHDSALHLVAGSFRYELYLPNSSLKISSWITLLKVSKDMRNPK